MKINLLPFLDILCALAAYIFSCDRYEVADRMGKTIVFLLLLCCLTEIAAEISYLLCGNKALIFHFSGVMNFMLVSLYFIQTMKPAKSSIIIISVMTGLPILSFANSFFLQPINKPNTNILVLRSFCIIAMSLIALYKILIDEHIKKATRYPHFYFWGLLLIMHTGTFFFWGLLLIIAKQSKPYLSMIQWMQGSINALVYLGIGCTFLLYRQKIPYER